MREMKENAKKAADGDPENRFEEHGRDVGINA